MRVLHVGPKNFPPNHGGVEKVVYDLVTGMLSVESHVFTEWTGDDANGKVHTLPKWLWAGVSQIRRYCRENEIDVVHLHKEPFIPYALVLTLLGTQCILTLHGCAWRLRRWPLHYRLAFFGLDLLACVFLHRVTFVGRRDWALFRKLVPFRRLVHIPNGVEPRSPNRGTRVQRLVYLGRLSAEKNIVGLIRAAERAGVGLDLYGPFDRHDPVIRKTILNMVQQSSFVAWKGVVPANRVAQTLSEYGVFVNASFSEGMPISVLEAASVGLSLVLSDIPQHKELEFPSCSYVDPHAISLDKAVLSQNSGHLNQKHAALHFGVTRMVDSYYGLYRELSIER